MNALRAQNKNDDKAVKAPAIKSLQPHQRASGENGATAGVPLFLLGGRQSAAAVSSFNSGVTPPLQRQVHGAAKEKKQPQPFLQAKLTIGQPNDKYEQEADRVADHVMRMSDADVAQRVETDTVQPMRIQRLCPECGGELQRQPVEEEEEEQLQTKEIPGHAPEVHPNIESRINSMKGGGQPLDPATRSFFEPRFGHDFSHVRVHSDSAAADTAKSIHARAFTLGNHVAMGSGEYQPQSKEGKRLLGHELTHVVQQGEGEIRSKEQSRGSIKSGPIAYIDSKAEMLPFQLTTARSSGSLAGNVAQANSSGEVIQRQTIRDSTPEGVNFQDVGVSFNLPGARALTNDWNQLETQRSTRVSLTVNSGGIGIRFRPSLLIDAQFPVGNITWQGLNYHFGPGAITWDGLVGGHGGFTAYVGDARSRVSSFFTSLISGTRMATAGYNPLDDPDIQETLAAIQNNFTSLPSSGGGVTASDVTGISASVSLDLASPIVQSTGEGGVRIGGSVDINLDLQGTAADVGTPVASQLRISGSSMIVTKDGEDIARIHNMSILPGGQVIMGQITLLGSAEKFAGYERMGRFSLLLLVLSEGIPSDRFALAGVNPDLSARAVPGHVRRELETAFSEIFKQLIRDNHYAFPQLNLSNLFGVPILGDFPTDGESSSRSG